MFNLVSDASQEADLTIVVVVDMKDVTEVILVTRVAVIFETAVQKENVRIVSEAKTVRVGA